jgi:CRISPR-associated exonuclease Cas4
MNITGTIVNYYFHCKRQCWLFANRINLEDNSEDVRIGKVLHELKSEGKKNTEIAIDNIKIDKINDIYLTEVKKSDSDLNAVKWQTLFYLKILKEKGIDRKGKIEVIEKKTTDKKIHYIELDEDREKEMEKLIIEIESFINTENPPKAILIKGCKKCAYYEYCFL